jgi:Sec-independent protein secretion pathway component TatC
MKYITLLLTFVYGSLAVATFLTAGTDPVMNIMAFICLTGALGFGFVTDRLFALAEEKQMLLDEWRNAPAHAVDDNQPDWERIQNEPAYLRRD